MSWSKVTLAASTWYPVVNDFTDNRITLVSQEFLSKYYSKDEIPNDKLEWAKEVFAQYEKTQQQLFDFINALENETQL